MLCHSHLLKQVTNCETRESKKDQSITEKNQKSDKRKNSDFCFLIFFFVFPPSVTSRFSVSLSVIHLSFLGFLVFGFGFLEFYQNKKANLGKDFSGARCFQNRDPVFFQFNFSYFSSIFSFFLSVKSPERVIFVSLKVGFK